MVELTASTMQAIYDNMQKGMDRKNAFRAAGIKPATSAAWYKRSIAGQEPYHGFYQGIVAVEQEVESSSVNTIADSPDWRAHAWLLERRNPDKWGQKIQIEFQERVKELLLIAQTVLDPEDYERLEDAISTRGGDGASLAALSEPSQDCRPN